MKNPLRSAEQVRFAGDFCFMAAPGMEEKR